MLRLDAKKGGVFVNKDLGTKCGRGWVGIRGNCRRSTSRKSGKGGLTEAQKAKAQKIADKIRHSKGLKYRNGPSDAKRDSNGYVMGKNVNLNAAQEIAVKRIFRRGDKQKTKVFVDSTATLPQIHEITPDGQIKRYQLSLTGQESEEYIVRGDRGIVNRGIVNRAAFSEIAFFGMNQSGRKAVNEQQDAKAERDANAASERETIRRNRIAEEQSQAEKKQKLSEYRQGVKGRKGVAEIKLGDTILKGPATLYGETLALHKTINHVTGKLDGSGRKDMTYTVTHLPSGLSLGKANTMNAAKSIVGAAMNSKIHEAQDRSQLERLDLTALKFATENHYYA